MQVIANQLNTNKFANRYGKFVRGCAVIAALSYTISEAQALCNNKCATGHANCENWCSSHYKSVTNGYVKCILQCDKYWLSGDNPQSLTIGPSDPTISNLNGRPQRVTGQHCTPGGRLKQRFCVGR